MAKKKKLKKAPEHDDLDLSQEEREEIDQLQDPDDGFVEIPSGVNDDPEDELYEGDTYEGDDDD